MSDIDRSQHPPYIFPDYKSSRLRGPTKPQVDLGKIYAGHPGSDAIESSASLLGRFTKAALDHDLTRNAQQGGEPIGERIVISGRVLDERGKPVPGALIEIWQANSSGRYAHKVDQHDAPLDPNFLGAGRCITDRDGGYRFYTIKPGAYPWQNHPNAWRPQHIHFSVVGDSIVSRLITQMYFPGDPLLVLDPIFKAVPAAAGIRLISHFDLSVTEPDFALGYRFDIVVAGSNATPQDDHKENTQ
jgi:protocatechuate 3,4-dioxygenase beta subunit